jgi:hypothetical protein
MKVVRFVATIPVLAGLVVFAWPARGASPPPPNPVLVVLAPIALPGCDAATLAISALPVLEPSLASLGGPLLQAAGPFVALCGSLPRPGHPIECVLDPTTQSTLNKLLKSAGVPIPVTLQPISQIAEEVAAIQAVLPGVAATAALASLASTTLQCAAVKSPPPVSIRLGHPAPVPTVLPVVTLPPAPPAAAPVITTPAVSIPAVVSVPTTNAPAAALPAPTPLSVLPAVKHHGFRYPEVFLIPFVLVIGVALFGQLLIGSAEEV